MSECHSVFIRFPTSNLLATSIHTTTLYGHRVFCVAKICNIGMSLGCDFFSRFVCRARKI